MVRNKITISLSQKKALLGILFVTCILCLSFYAQIIFLTSYFNWYSLTTDKILAGGQILFRINAFVLPTVFYFLSYGVQLVLIFLKPSKTKFVFSIISYVNTIILFGYLIFYSVIVTPYVTTVRTIEITLWSFVYILFLLLIVFNFSLMIFITHVKVQDEVKSTTKETIIKTKLGKTYLVIFIIFAVLTVLYFGSIDMYKGTIEKIFRGRTISEDKIKRIYKTRVGFIIIFNITLMIGESFQIVSIIDANKKKLGFIGYILEIVGFVPPFIFMLLNLFMMPRIEFLKQTNIVTFIFYFLTLVLFIVNIVFCFIIRNKQKVLETKEIKLSEE